MFLHFAGCLIPSFFLCGHWSHVSVVPALCGRGVDGRIFFAGVVGGEGGRGLKKYCGFPFHAHSQTLIPLWSSFLLSLLCKLFDSLVS